LLVATHRGQYNELVLQENSHETTLCSGKCKKERGTSLRFLRSDSRVIPRKYLIIYQHRRKLHNATSCCQKHIMTPHDSSCNMCTTRKSRSFKRPYFSVPVLSVFLHPAALNRMHSGRGRVHYQRLPPTTQVQPLSRHLL
jgi:hypothetical protein